MEELKIVEQKGLKDLKVFQVNEYDAVAAYDVDEAIEWYSREVALDEEDIDDDVEEVPLDYKVYEEEGTDEMVTVGELISRYWKGEPFVVFTSA